MYMEQDRINAENDCIAHYINDYNIDQLYSCSTYHN